MTGEDFITLAGKLAAATGATEASLRTAVSRAYYGAFHIVKRFFDDVGVKVSRDHGEYQRCLMQCAHPRAVLAGRYLNDLHTSRIKADYDLTNRDVSDGGFAKECVELASDIRLT